MNQQQREEAFGLASSLEGDARTMRLAGQKDSVVEDMELAAALLRSLAEEKQGEPVAWIHPGDMATLKQLREAVRVRDLPYWAEDIPLYTHPPAKQEPLTEEEVSALFVATTSAGDWSAMGYARAIESACAKKWEVKL